MTAFPVLLGYQIPQHRQYCIIHSNLEFSTMEKTKYKVVRVIIKIKRLETKSIMKSVSRPC